MEAARVAALRGHDVTLYDKRDKLGGQVLMSIAQESKREKYQRVVDYYDVQLKKLKVKIKLETEVSPSLIEKDKPDVVIIATGATPLIPDIHGIKDPRVVTAWDILEAKENVRNQRVLVAGGGMVGAELAEFLTDRGNTVTVVEMLPKIAEDMEVLNRRGLMDALKEKKVTLLTEHPVVEVVKMGLVATDMRRSERKVIEADRIVLAMGSKPVAELADALQGKVPELYTVGDCNRVRRIVNANYEGALIASQI